ncbi:MAG: oxygen-independent coproporphyrinogen III oxidase [cyanobacterium endosymbiont of Rhopalodia musculus]|uniref:oxygen-independent coproporphyrinogen III oxidase n=1 Tax=cyanobacterium endosymbiont of Epithemia clementina EcSB TaxID=3034674 RepID=UPI002480039C|nr:oxygen-independent coproporphyrinogen III oxidase [cyanobacterium endosymbiont of Epithemia clementina EcSB]WGT67637.1 oxygen-independent coproporphyrinogen III oxidase [cyanobacterium endosymbiont of Epithemia clementina EcSB]
MMTNSQTVQFDTNLLNKYNKSVPRYTSYPPATELKTEVKEIDFRGGIIAGNYKRKPISLYCHIPFCETACYFCGCNTIITKNKRIAPLYLDYLIQDIRQTAALISPARQVNQIHLGGGTPNYLNQPQLERLFSSLVKNFNIDQKAEISIEINPRYIDKNYIFFLKKLGFNRISFGIQDFNSKVQEAINRIQPESMLFNVMDWIREAEFEGANVDLIYGLPFQTLETFKETVRKTIKLNPDRIALFNFAYMPWLKAAQKNISETDLPQVAEKLAIFQMTIEKLNCNGYMYIGMDHFAKPNDELAIAQQEGKLHRNFQGYTTKPESDLFAFGVTAISMLNDVYIQNYKPLKSYYKALFSGNLPIEKGVSLHRDDIIRRAIIMELMCQFKLNKSHFEGKYNLQFNPDFNFDFDQYFFDELVDLKSLEADGLVKLFSDYIEVTPPGRLLIRNIASIFDTYLKRRKEQSFSKAI